MEALNTNLGEIYFYIKSDVIFDIKPYDNGDSCAKKGVSAVTDGDKEVEVPYFTVKKDEVSTNYFLTNFIADGDSNSNNTFRKHNDGEGNGKTIYEYYQEECEEAVKNAIKSYPSEDVDFFTSHKDLLGVPLFMLTDEGYTIEHGEGLEQIDVASNFDGYKEEIVQQEAWNAANLRAKDFGYKVTSEVEDLTVEKITD